MVEYKLNKNQHTKMVEYTQKPKQHSNQHILCNENHYNSLLTNCTTKIGGFIIFIGRNAFMGEVGNTLKVWTIQSNEALTQWNKKLMTETLPFDVCPWLNEMH